MTHCRATNGVDDMSVMLPGMKGYKQPIKVVSLFDGMSCGQIALNRIGVNVGEYYASEIDKPAITVTKDNYPDTIHVGDVSKAGLHNLPYRPTLMMGGSPCQGFSRVGGQLAFDDPRSVLFFEYVRLLKLLDPDYFLLENVRMARKHQDVISEYLGCEPVEINSSILSGASRPRLYWTDIPFSPIEPIDVDMKSLIDWNDMSHNSANWHKWWASKKGYRLDKKYSAILNDVDKAICLIANHRKNWDGNLVRNPLGLLRFITPVEGERLMTVPDNYTAAVSNAQRYKMLGNGWTVDVIAHILRGMNL